jgi:signal transduction histidine kinase
MVLNKNGHIEWINKTATDMFGRPHPHKSSDLDSDISATLNELVPREVKLLTVNNTRVAVTATYFSAGGKDLKLISFKNIQSALEEHESDSWRKLISVLTHEMMNSITPILSLSETLSDETADSENRHAVMQRAMQTIHRRSKGLVDFVKNYRQLTRIPEPVPVSISVHEMLSDIYRLLKAEGIDFLYNTQPHDIQLNADRSQIEQVLINLIKNAWEACRDMSQPKIVIETHKNEYQKPVITISDNGCGIIPGVMDKIFVPFFTTKTGGSGIGLTICRQIMNLHHGNITIESEVDKGTRVTLRF